jgi:hypothetical protein
MKNYILILIMLSFMATSGKALDISINNKDYQQGGVFVKPLLPVENENFTIGIRAKIEGKMQGYPEALVTISDKVSKTIWAQRIQFVQDGTQLVARLQAKISQNGIYQLKVVLDPQNKLEEDNENNNIASIKLPILVKGRSANFVWFVNPEFCRWTTLITAVIDKTGNVHSRLKERGIVPLKWEYGGKNYQRYLDKYSDIQARKECKKAFDKIYGTRDKSIQQGAMGFGCDEFGGYPGTRGETFSKIALKCMLEARKKNPDLIFAAWHGGGVRTKLAEIYRNAVDFLLLETYVFRAIPWDLKAENIYAHIDVRLKPLIRATDMINPAYGSKCTTLVALDVCERPDLINPAEFENVIRYIRRICPEMRGICFYNGGYGNYNYKRSPEHKKVRDNIFRLADSLCYKYYINACVTLMPNSLWIVKEHNKVMVAVSNIGCIDSGPVTVELFIDGKKVDSHKVAKVPAGADRTKNRAIVVFTLDKLTSGTHELKAKITHAENATVLDSQVETARYY